VLTNQYTPAVGDVIAHPEWNSDMRVTVKYVGDRYLIGDGGPEVGEVSFLVERAWVKVS
jgi:hypothetical protein